MTTQPTPKQVLAVPPRPGGHWVGDGFPVRSLFSYPSLGRELSPFLLLDHAGPAEFPPTDARLGVGEHPHRGFETVTIVYKGQVAHRDSSGGGGTIGPGDVQWMTAASGVVHEEFHGPDFAREGGEFEMVQLWVNLPAKDKMSAPRYQGILDAQIPVVDMPGGAGSVRVIAGEYLGERGPAKTFTPVNVWDLSFTSDDAVEFTVPDGFSGALVVLHGSVRVDGSREIGASELAVFSQPGSLVRVDHAAGATALLLSGEPIDEPIVGQGPFVMNTEGEIRQAMMDYRSGEMGRLA